MSSIEMTGVNKRSPLVASTEKIYRKMIRRPAYRLALFVLGLPTFIIVMVNHYIFANKNNSYAELKKTICDNLQQKGIREKLYEESKASHRKKLEFMGKSISEDRFENEVQKIVSKRFNEIVEDELARRTAGTDIKPSSLSETYCRMLNNKFFLIVSVVSSVLMYILMLIYANPYAKYIFERLFMMIFVIFGVTFLVFTILYISPSDPAHNVLGDLATPAQIETFNEVYGLDKPYVVQLVNAFKGLVTFDMGKSYMGNEDVMVSIARKFPSTLKVTIASLIVSLSLSIIPGIISAMKQYSSYDYIFMLIALLGLSIPNFWLGLILILNFSIKLGWLPATYSATNALTLIMPAVVLGTGMSATLARMTRSSMLEVKNQDFVLTAKAKGLSNKTVTFKHILGNAMIPIVTAVGLQFGGLLGGSSVTEKVFNISGIGSFIVDKQFIPDIPVVLAGVVYVAVIISLVNLAVDILYAFLDPRIKSKMKSY